MCASLHTKIMPRKTLQITVELDAEQVEQLNKAIIKRNKLKQDYQLLGLDLAKAESDLLDIQMYIAQAVFVDAKK